MVNLGDSYRKWLLKLQTIRARQAIFESGQVILKYRFTGNFYLKILTRVPVSTDI